MKLKKSILIGFIALLGLSSCGKFEKFRKSASLPVKYKAAVDYYKKKDFNKASILFDEILPLMKGDSTQEMATYYQAYCDFNLGNFTVANAHFKKFYEVFSRSEYAEEAIYMSAYSMYKDSPNYNLDQTGTLTAIEELQSYLNNYPDSKYREDNDLLPLDHPLKNSKSSVKSDLFDEGSYGVKFDGCCPKVIKRHRKV